MALPVAPGSYSPRDQDEIRRILTEGVDGMVRRIYSLEQAPPVVPSTGLGLTHAIWTAMPTPTTFAANIQAFNSHINADSKDTIIPRINTARAAGQKIFLFPHASHVWATKAGKFDMPTWTARLQTCNTPAIVDAVKAALADGTVVGHMTVEEPQHADYGGNVTRADLDSCASQVKALYGANMPVGCNVISYFRPTDGPYTVLDFTQSQFVYSTSTPYLNDPVQWRNGRLQDSADSNVKWMAGLNPANGGAGFNINPCPVPPTFGPGFDTGRCAMSAAQIVAAGQAVIAPDSLGRSAVGLWHWRHWDPYFADGSIHAAFQTVADTVALRPTRSLLRGQP